MCGTNFICHLLLKNTFEHAPLPTHFTQFKVGVYFLCIVSFFLFLFIYKVWNTTNRCKIAIALNRKNMARPNVWNLLWCGGCVLFCLSFSLHQPFNSSSICIGFVVYSLYMQLNRAMYYSLVEWLEKYSFLIHFIFFRFSWISFTPFNSLYSTPCKRSSLFFCIFFWLSLISFTMKWIFHI